MENASIIDVLGRTLAQAEGPRQPRYPTPETIPTTSTAVEQADHRHRRHADDPAFHRPGRQRCARGHARRQAGYRSGDGVMIAGDVRTLAAATARRARRLLRAVRRSPTSRASRPGPPELDRLDHGALRRPVGARQMFIDRAGQPAPADSGAVVTHAVFVGPGLLLHR